MVPLKGVNALVLAVFVESSARLARSVEILAMTGRARCRASTGDSEGSVRDGLGVPTSSRPHLTPTRLE